MVDVTGLGFAGRLRSAGSHRDTIATSTFFDVYQTELAMRK